MRYTQDGNDDGKPEYTGVRVYLSRVEAAVEVLKGKLVDRDTNLGMNESYRLALDELLALLKDTGSSNK